MKNILLILFTTLFISIFTSQALAFRCDNEIVSRWDTSASTMKKCGSPFKTEANKWYYNCGEKDFIYEITFNGSTIIKIETSGRGTDPSQCHTPK